jgi:hypothetical protein
VSLPDAQLAIPHSHGAAIGHEPVVGDEQVEIVNPSAELALNMFLKLGDFVSAEGVHGLYAVVHRITLLAAKPNSLCFAVSLGIQKLAQR